ncbi:putative delta-60 repeat protein [Geothermobacter ehrlichii]|uniref:Putative delta-60 repeat protein n=1 Tax=Geothermobacter ehrlichii TaxID=213224 RepID=A0A5D3WJZ5_9BACT|nr:delta-60 repeat domain-containing protein [Geothermobacter ehrlichii]TYO98668.1 putative delta-60 repeat protein [Geothermobacter ehrlichii]
MKYARTILSGLLIVALGILPTGCGSGGGVPTFTVGGTVTGLDGTLVLQNNGKDSLTITADGTFTFASPQAIGSTCSVTIATQPPSQSCYVTNGSRTISDADVADIEVHCYDSGTPDPTFGTAGVVVYDNPTQTLSYWDDWGCAITTDTTGRILVTGASYESHTLTEDMLAWRYNPDGSLDSSFGSGGVVTDLGETANTVNRGVSVTVDANGRIVIMGTRRNFAGNLDLALWRYNANGVLDASFGNGGIVISDNAAGGNRDDAGYAGMIDSSGRILVAGASDNGSDRDLVVWRFREDGTPDLTFGNGGVVVYDHAGGNLWGDQGVAIAEDADGKILVTGYVDNGSNNDMALWRFNADGSLDASFGNSGVVVDDNAAGGNDNDAGLGCALDLTGRILVTGWSMNGHDGDMVLWAFNGDGSPDMTFGNAGKVVFAGPDASLWGDIGNGLLVDANGRIVVVGAIGRTSGPDMAVWRFNPDGTPDVTFGTGGVMVYDAAFDAGGIDDVGWALTIDADGKLLVTGYSRGVVSSDMVVWRVIP